jgi:diguanylate cyclase (GGDEF)-like protein
VPRRAPIVAFLLAARAAAPPWPRRLRFLRESGWAAAVLVVTVLGMVGLSALSWFTISATSQASARVRTASVAADAYNRTRDALEGIESAEHVYVFRPALDRRNTLTRSMGTLDLALAQLGMSASARGVPAGAAERRAIAGLDADGRRLATGIDRVAAMAANRDALNVSITDANRVHPVLRRMLDVVDRQAADHQRVANASLATSQATDRRASIVVLITGVLCITISWMVVRMLRLRRRLAEVHRREIARLRDAALRDSLTGLRNHRCFQEDIRRSLAGDSGLHALLIDMDGLKAINDRLGHQAGDERICQLAAALTAACAGIDADAYRIGGDEFAIIAAGRNHRPERIADAVHDALGADECTAVTATIGIASASPGMSADELLRRADMALIVGKPARCSTRSYSRALEDAPGSAESERAELLAIIDDPAAIAPVFQPIVDLHTGEVLGHEALSRFPAADWRNPQEWFQLAHAHDLAIELEAAAVRAALSAPDRPAVSSVNLNISPSVLLSARDRIGLPDDLSSITIEVTEDALVTEGPDLELALLELRARGARIAVDDAGAGYAGFTQLVRIRPDVIKLDRSLVAGVDADPLKAAVVEAFVHFAGSTDAVVCAEGIETPGELHAITNLGADSGQGFLLGRPTPGGATGPAPLLALPWPATAAAAKNVVPLRRAASG